ncbi:hypothetical protein [Chromohalobacter israelensis]|uniref:hypothetical protein n=1 Tax=Chromohalobacter israelensis TaxID=141390 RepID=UPI00265C8954|nr:hypothetical protein [Chromohalobacter salexigens]MDO0944652.1 hypothetical protein [Chromohalobacter salexigens]
MVAATQNRNTPTRLNQHRGHPVAADAVCFAGTIAMGDGGYAKPGVTATGLTALGAFTHYVSNAGGADGDMTAVIERGCFRFANSSGADEITRADIGQVCFVVDDQTVAGTNGDTGTGATRSPAGIVDDIDEVGVWVCIDPTNGVAATA